MSILFLLQNNFCTPQRTGRSTDAGGRRMIGVKAVQGELICRDPFLMIMNCRCRSISAEANHRIAASVQRYFSTWPFRHYSDKIYPDMRLNV